MPHYEINAPDVVSETIDGEAVILNLKDGDYHSSLDIGSAVWEWIQAGYAVESIENALEARFPESASEIAKDVADLLAQLEKENLIRPASSEPRMQSPDVGILENTHHYSKPELNSYRDMQDLLLLDPVHEIDDAGWPEPAKG
jgi:hypothetical protein